MCIPGTALSRYINFYTDFAFKKIFGTEANKDLLISFLNGLFNLEGDEAIEDVTYLNTEQLGENAFDRRAIYDVYCKTGKGERFIVEMQKALQDSFRDRALYYSSFAVRDQGVKGSRSRPWDYRLAPVYVVGVLNFEMQGSNPDRYITHVKLKDDDNQVFSENLNFVFLEMPKFNKTENELDTFCDKWLFVLKNLYKLENCPAALTEGIFRKLFEVAEIASYSTNERSVYEESLKNLWDLNNCLETAERKGKEVGREEGRAEGRAEGEAIGLEKGRAEGEYAKSMEHAKKMKAKGFSLQEIAEITELKIEEIEKL
ncbi:MAG: Rpn family recombination-promoting nuclease/putative transposase [Paludibacteraceae bacterium]|nr:Rpn family recombination-promoting nuclease/putative transposase [Paludibacteraceae bacterium]